MAIIFNNQSEEWKEAYREMSVAEAQTKRYLEAFPGALTEEEVNNMCNWEELDKRAVQATPEELAKLDG